MRRTARRGGPAQARRRAGHGHRRGHPPPGRATAVRSIVDAGREVESPTARIGVHQHRERPTCRRQGERRREHRRPGPTAASDHRHDGAVRAAPGCGRDQRHEVGFSVRQVEHVRCPEGGRALPRRHGRRTVRDHDDARTARVPSAHRVGSGGLREHDGGRAEPPRSVRDRRQHVDRPSGRGHDPSHVVGQGGIVDHDGHGGIGRGSGSRRGEFGRGHAADRAPSGRSGEPAHSHPGMTTRPGENAVGESDRRARRTGSGPPAGPGYGTTPARGGGGGGRRRSAPGGRAERARFVTGHNEVYTRLLSDNIAPRRVVAAGPADFR